MQQQKMDANSHCSQFSNKLTVFLILYQSSENCFIFNVLIYLWFLDLIRFPPYPSYIFLINCSTFHSEWVLISPSYQGTIDTLHSWISDPNANHRGPNREGNNWFSFFFITRYQIKLNADGCISEMSIVWMQIFLQTDIQNFNLSALNRYIFTIASYLIGVFIFATIVGKRMNFFNIANKIS